MVGGGSVRRGDGGVRSISCVHYIGPFFKRESMHKSEVRKIFEIDPERRWPGSFPGR
jgi:hypothetical protein